MDRRAAHAVLWILVFTGAVSIAHDTLRVAPNYEIVFPDYQYHISASSLRNVEFKSLTVFWYRNDRFRPSAQLSAGSFERTYQGGAESITLDFVKLLSDPGTTTTQHAVIDVDWKSCGGSCSENGLVQVFELRSGHPTVVEQIRYGRHAPETGVSLDLNSNVLTITGRSSEPSPNCCPASLDVMTFEWNGKKFAFKGSKRRALPNTP